MTITNPVTQIYLPGVVAAQVVIGAGSPNALIYALLTSAQYQVMIAEQDQTMRSVPQ
jgi:hypothetical protein